MGQGLLSLEERGRQLIASAFFQNRRGTLMIVGLTPANIVIFRLPNLGWYSPLF
jgi:hypothetical protein